MRPLSSLLRLPLGVVLCLLVMGPAAMAAAQPPTGVVRIAENQFPTSLDGDVGFAGYTLMSYGVAEALMRVTPDMQIVPWIAASLEQVDDLTWRATLRDDVTFWDGTPVDAAAVKSSLERSIDKQPGSVALLPGGTQFTAEGKVLQIVLPEPVGALPNNLAAYNFTLKKIPADADDSPIYTGPYMYDDFVPQQSMVLHAYQAYRGGPSAVSTIEVRRIPDVSARVLALQAGDVDIAHALLPSDAAPLAAAGFQV